MSDREKALVLNGLRNYLRSVAISSNMDVDLVDASLIRVARKMMIEPSILESVRHEQQEFLAEIENIAGFQFTYEL